MSVDKLVDSTQLDSDLTSVANAIRAKSGGSSQLAFPAGFVSEIQAIPSGGGGDYTAGDFANKEKPEGVMVFDVTTVQSNYLTGRTKVTKIYAPNFSDTSNVNGRFNGLTSLEYLIIPSNTRVYNNGIFGCSNLLAVDCKGLQGTGSSNMMAGNPKLATIVIRSAGTPRFDSISNSFNNTPFRSGGTGGTLYVPQFMIAKYQATTNWATLLSYPNNNIVALEGSPYESKYVDGVTDVPTRTITQNLTHCSSSYSKATMYWQTGYQITFTPDAGYTISSVTITVGGADYSSTYDSNTGKAEFNVVGDVVITAIAS